MLNKELITSDYLKCNIFLVPYDCDSDHLEPHFLILIKKIKYLIIILDKECEKE
jgi:hypothetical protein